MAFGLEAHKTQERRLALRVLAFWREFCDDESFPSRSAFNLAALGDDARFCFLVDLGGRPALRGIFAHLGHWLAGHQNLVGRPVSEAAPETLLGAAVAPLDRLVEWREPVSHGGETRLAGQRFLYRSILLPLSEDGTGIDAVLGAANGRLIGTEGLSSEG